MEEDDVDDDGPEDGESERDEAADEEKESADDLAGCNGVDVAAGKEGVQKFANEALGQGRHGEEAQEAIRANDDEDKPKQNPNDDGEDFHGCVIPKVRPVW